MVLSLIGGILGASASKSAAKTQAAAATKAAETQLTATRETNAQLDQWRDEDIARFDPFYGLGVDATNALRFEMGLGPAPTVGATRTPLEIQAFNETIPGTPGTGSTDPRATAINAVFGGLSGLGGGLTFGGQPAGTPGTPDRNVTRYRVGDSVFDSMDEAQKFANANATTSGGTPYQGFTATPGYEFRRQQGLDAVQGSVAARQGLLSGSALKGMERFGQDYASNEYGNYLARLSGLGTNGQNAAGMQSASGQNYGMQIGQNTIAGGNAMAQGLQQAGNADAAGKIGSWNSLAGGIEQAVGGWQQQNLLKAFAPTSGGAASASPAWAKWIF